MSVFISIWNGDVTLFEHILCVNVWASIALWFAFNWKENQTKKEWVTIKPEENSSGKMWINICNNRQMSWRGYPIHNTIMLLFPQENKNTILKLYQTWQGSGLSFGQKTEPGPLQLLTEVQAIVCFFFFNTTLFSFCSETRHWNEGHMPPTDFRNIASCQPFRKQLWELSTPLNQKMGSISSPRGAALCVGASHCCCHVAELQGWEETAQPQCVHSQLPLISNMVVHQYETP